MSRILTLLFAAALVGGCAREPERVQPALTADESKPCAEIHKEIEQVGIKITSIKTQLDKWGWSRMSRFKAWFSLEARRNADALAVELHEYEKRMARLENVEERRCNLYKKEGQ